MAISVAIAEPSSDSLKCIAWKGRALVVGFAGGQIEKVHAHYNINLKLTTIQLPLNLVLLKNISIVGIHWGAYAKFDKGRSKEVWKELLGCVSLLWRLNWDVDIWFVDCWHLVVYSQWFTTKNIRWSM